MQQLGGGLKIQDVAGIVLIISKTPSPPSICIAHSNILSGVGEVKISGQAPESMPADIAAVHRFMSAAAAGEQGHLASHRRVGAGHIQRVLMQGQLRMGFSQPCNCSFSTSSTRLISFFIIQCSVGEGSMPPLCWRRRSSRRVSSDGGACPRYDDSG